MKNKKFIIGSFIITVIVGIVIISLLMLNKEYKNNTENNNDKSGNENNNNNNVLSDNSTTSNNDNENQITNGSENDMSNNEFASKINININGTNYSATLEDNETTREFVKRLPLELDMSELNGNEKYYYFDDSLPSNSKKIGKIQNGDLMLYGSDCLVLFYETFNSSYSYTRIGKIDNPSSLKKTVGSGSIKISFTK